MDNPTPAVVIGVEAVCVENAILLDYSTSKVALQEPNIRSTDPNILIDNNCTEEDLHFGMPWGSQDYEDEADKSNERDTIPTTSRQRWAATELETFILETSDADVYKSEDGNDADVDEEEEASQVDDGSTQNVVDCGHSRFDLGTGKVDRSVGKDGDDADKHEDASPADNGSTHNVVDWEHSSRECEDCTVCFRPLK